MTQPTLPSLPDFTPLQEQAWVEVISKMEEVYSDLIRHETELEKKNAELEKAQQFIHSVLSSMSEVLIVCDKDNNIREVNKACLTMTGLAEASLINRPLQSLIHLSDCGPEIVETLCRANQKTYQDVRLRMHDGTPSDPVSFNCSSLIDHSGRLAGKVLIGRPMGELRRAYAELNAAHSSLKKAQAQLVQSEKLASIGRLVAGVAHELNNPISFINGNMHVLDGYRQKLAAYLEAIHGEASAEHLQELRAQLRIDNLLKDLPPLIEGTLEGARRVSDIVKSLRRLSFSGKSAPESFDLTSVLHNSLRWTTKGESKGVRLNAEAIAPDLEVIGDQGQIHQVMVNLIGNALDAVSTVAAPRIDLSAQRQGRRVRVTIRDNGPGIPKDDMLKIFDPFFTTKPVGEGTGLGLWISYDIIANHGSELKARNCGVSGSEPEGVEFSFDLPAP